MILADHRVNNGASLPAHAATPRLSQIVTIQAPGSRLRRITAPAASLMTSEDHSPSAVTEFAAEPEMCTGSACEVHDCAANRSDPPRCAVSTGQPSRGQRRHIPPAKARSSMRSCSGEHTAWRWLTLMPRRTCGPKIASFRLPRGAFHGQRGHQIAKASGWRALVFARTLYTICTRTLLRIDPQ